MTLIAVYGTLKRGFHNHYLLETSKFISKGHTGEGYSLFIDKRSALPFLIQDSSGTGCEFEIYEVDEDVLQSLDLLEGHPHFYKRSSLKKIDDQELWIYIYQPECKYFKRSKKQLPIQNFE